MLGFHLCIYAQVKIGSSNSLTYDIDADSIAHNKKIAEEYYAEGVKLNNKFKYTEAEIPLQKAIDMGNIEAAYYLGMMYLDYDNAGKGFPLILKAAELGHKDAVFKVAELYNTGTGTPKDKDKAKMWYRKAEALEDPEAKVYIRKDKLL